MAGSAFFASHPLGGSFLRSWLAQPSGLRRSFCLLFYGLCLEKLSQNFYERYRYAAPRLALRQDHKK
ncbi:MAG: hypothetical protein MSC50_05960 [Campylobacter sp.]|uniref:hypothetical protein n=1 Tax=Campylobacter sp. TaxID=205 RepID=UPI002AA686D3|nr:hypothetical protein [Campylobacter sp.]MCI6579800.1 hypothetical protein [Campylobacter sp.]